MLQKISRARSLTIFIVSALLCACGNNDRLESSGRPALSYPAYATSRNFTAGGIRYSPADLEELHLAYRFDVAKGEAQATARIKFRVREEGKSFLLSHSTIESSNLDGVPIATNRVQDPDGLSSLLVPEAYFLKGETHELELSFHLPSSIAGFHAGGVSMISAMSDFPGGNYLEAYAPIGFEDDELLLHLDLELVGASKAHRLYANGEISQPSANRWHVEFPSYFHASSFFFHFTDSAFEERRITVNGIEKSIPVTVYSSDAAQADAAIALLPGVFAELESSYGAYPHASFVAYIYGRGGMEHSGATVTSVSALPHELTHSWFARGVMPADGRSGWIDEAVASWRDNGYFRAGGIGNRAPTNLGRFSAFQRFTTPNCYVDGRNFLAELDLLMASQGGIRPFLRNFFQKWKRKSVHNDNLEADLIAYGNDPSTAQRISDLYQRYVYAAGPEFHDPAEDSLMRNLMGKTHPPAYSQEDIEKMR